MIASGLRIVVLLGHRLSPPRRSATAEQAPAPRKWPAAPARSRARSSSAWLADVLGPCDVAAIAAALAVRAARGGTITALAVGLDEHTTPTLEAALAAGCDGAASLSPDADWSLTRTADIHDTTHPPHMDIATMATLDEDGEASSYIPLSDLSTAALAAAALEQLGCDLVLCGELSADGYQAMMGPAVAELLGMVHVSAVASVHPLPSGPALELYHRGGARVHRARCPLPAVLCLLAASPAAPTELSAVPPRARAQDIVRLRPEDLDVDTDRLHHLPGWPFQRRLTMRRAELLDSAAAVVSRLAADRLVTS